MFSGYYTDEEPESAFVVEVDGVVSGYLLGAIDARRAWDPGKVAARHVLRRGIALRRGTAGVIWRTVVDGVADVATKRLDPSALGFHDPAYPAHLHIDLLPEARGAGAGRRLVELWLERLRALDVPGCHLETFAENTGALAFFRSVGFEATGPPVLIPGFRRRGAPRMHTQAMVRAVSP
jgi:ribosomal protein S18 acetylase RimI-like enzyme